MLGNRNVGGAVLLQDGATLPNAHQVFGGKANARADLAEQRADTAYKERNEAYREIGELKGTIAALTAEVRLLKERLDGKDS